MRTVRVEYAYSKSDSCNKQNDNSDGGELLMGKSINRTVSVSMKRGMPRLLMPIVVKVWSPSMFL